MSHEDQEHDESIEYEPARVGIDRLRPDDAIHQQVECGPIPFAINPDDGLPSPVLPRNDGAAPPLCLDTFVCMADESAFVMRDRLGYIIKRFNRDQVEQTPSGTWVVIETKHIVFPLRPACEHYARQMIDFQGSTANVMVERCCTARRDSGGEFLSLANAQMIACELRAPRDPESEEYLRRYDALKVKQGEKRRRNGEGFDLSKIGRDPDADLDDILE